MEQKYLKRFHHHININIILNIYNQKKRTLLHDEILRMFYYYNPNLKKNAINPY